MGMLCSLITKKSNWEIPTKNLVTFKRQNGAKDEELQYFWVPRKNPSFTEGGSRKNNI